MREEKILRKGGEPERLNVYYNPQGTLDADPNQLGEGYQLLTAWTGDTGGGERSIQTWLELVGCTNTLAAMDLVASARSPRCAGSLPMTRGISAARRSCAGRSVDRALRRGHARRIRGPRRLARADSGAGGDGGRVHADAAALLPHGFGAQQHGDRQAHAGEIPITPGPHFPRPSGRTSTQGH